MTTLIHLLLGTALLAGSGIYGGDLFATLVLRAALTDIDDQALTTTMGRIHQYGDRRMPALFVIAMVTTILAVALAGVNGDVTVAIAAAIAVTALSAWLGVFVRISAPINKRFTRAVNDDAPLSEARALQRQWERALPIRLALQAATIAALCAASALA